MPCYLKFHFKKQLCGEEKQCIKSPFLLFLKTPSLKNKKGSLISIDYLLVVAINIFDF